MPSHRRNRRWLRAYLSEQHSRDISDDDSLQTVRRPPQWMFFFYDAA